MNTKLDYTLESPVERRQLVEQILQENPNPNARYLEILADYMILCMEKKEKREKKILTENRMITVNKRETSFEGLTSKLENGEDGIYNLIANDKNIIFSPAVCISEKDGTVECFGESVSLGLKTGNRDSIIINRGINGFF